MIENNMFCRVNLSEDKISITMAENNRMMGTVDTWNIKEIKKSAAEKGFSAVSSISFFESKIEGMNCYVRVSVELYDGLVS